ncbi:MAG TPA: hypothetical protein VNE58_09810 [Casimicrobiaceae bacterium]|nr:hypothetical protein [Casimicrobiaceae bacterium]
MMRNARSLFRLLFVIAIGCAPLAARGTDYGDLWWNPSESGWGIQTVQQNNVMFITFYVFGTDSRPTWFTGLLTAATSGGSTFTGTLVATTGPYYGGPFTPPAVNRNAGTITFTATSPTSANVTYTIDGVTVTKSVQRLQVSTLNLSGTYIGSFLSFQHSCAIPAANGPFNGSGTFTIVHNPPAPQVTITATLSDNLRAFACTYQGNYSQLGKIGSISGTYTCNDGRAGNWNANEIELSTLGGILGRYSGTNTIPGCQITGGFGGLKPPT